MKYLFSFIDKLVTSFLVKKRECEKYVGVLAKDVEEMIIELVIETPKSFYQITDKLLSIIIVIEIHTFNKNCKFLISPQISVIS